MRTYYSRFARKKVFNVFYSMSKDREKYLHEMPSFLKAMVALPYCYNHNIHTLSSCTCMKNLVDIDHAAGFIVDVGLLMKGE
jgi:hypothetical protein